MRVGETRKNYGTAVNAELTMLMSLFSEPPTCIYTPKCERHPRGYEFVGRNQERLNII